jgi:hypothetical protein
MAVDTEIYVAVTPISSYSSLGEGGGDASHPSSIFHFPAGFTEVRNSIAHTEFLNQFTVCQYTQRVSAEEGANYKYSASGTFCGTMSVLIVVKPHHPRNYRSIEQLKTLSSSPPPVCVDGRSSMLDNCTRTEDGCSVFLRNVGIYIQIHMVLLPRKLISILPVHCFCLHLRFLYELKRGSQYGRNTKQMTLAGQISSSNKLIYSMEQGFSSKVDILLAKKFLTF